MFLAMNSKIVLITNQSKELTALETLLIEATVNEVPNNQLVEEVANFYHDDCDVPKLRAELLEFYNCMKQEKV